MSLSLLSNRYRVLNVLGDGGFGKTFLVEDTQMPSNRKCVLKQLKPVHDGTNELRQLVQDRFQREAATLEMLGEEHAQIPRLYAYFSEDQQFYLVQEWIDGITIAEKVRHEGAQHEQMVKLVISDLLGAIAYIHSKGIVHRDIKPDNIILRSRDSKAVLIDFGAVKETMNTLVDSQAHSTRSIVVGTPGYMPAEQLSGRPVYASDLYGLGMSAIYMLTGKNPQEFPSDPASGELLWQAHAPSASPAFVNFLDRAIHTSVHERFATAQEMKTALQQLNLSTAPTQVNQQLVAYPEAHHPNTPTVTPSSATSVPTPATVTVQDAPIPSTYPQHTSAPASPAPASKNGLVAGSIVGVSVLIGAVILGRYLSPSVTSSDPVTEPAITQTLSTETEEPLVELDPIPVEPEPPQAPDAPIIEPEPSLNSPPIAAAAPPSASWVAMGTASSGEQVAVNENSIRIAGAFIDFEYRIGDELIAASADCFDNQWYAEQYGWYSPQSQATQSMLNFVCQ